MAEKIALELDINAQGATTSLGQLEQEAERLNEELRKVPLGSKAFKDLKSELIGVTKEINNTELSMEALDNEQVASGLGSVAGAVGDVSAAFILLGGSGGALEETVQNIEKAIGVSMAFKGAIEGTQSAYKLFNNVVKNSNVLQKANNASTALATTIMKGLGLSVNTTSTAFKGLRGAIAATGIGLLVVGVGALVANFDKIKAAVSGVSQASKDLAKATSLRLKTNIENLDAIENQTNILKLQGKTERQILKMKIDALKEIIDTNLLELEIKKRQNEEELEGVKANKERLKTILDILFLVPTVITRINDAIIDGINSLLSSLNDIPFISKLIGEEPIKINIKPGEFFDDLKEQAANLLFDPEETEKKGQEELEALEKSLLDRKNALAGYQLQVQDLDKKEFERKKTILEKQKADDDKKAEQDRAELIADREREAQELADFLLAKEEIENEYFDKKLSKEQQEINAVTDKYFNLMELARINGEGMAVLEEAQQSELNEIKKRYANEEIARQRQVDGAKLQIASDGIGSLIALNTSFAKDNEKSQKRAFEINKKLQIAQAIIQTYMGANAIFASAAANPATILFPAQPFIQAGLAIAAGIANVNNIRKQKFQGGTASAGAAGGTTAPSIATGGGGDAPIIDPANTSMLVPQQQSQVFVTETDITATQNQVAVIQGQSTIR